MTSSLINTRDKIEPFWLRIPKFFTYPLHNAVLMVMIIFSLLQLLTLLPGIGWLVRLLLWLAAYKYSYEVLIHTAKGQLDPPESSHIYGMDSMGFKQISLTLGMGLILLVAQWITQSPFFVGILTLFMLLAFPAAIMILAMTQSIAAAMNPLTWVALMQRVGAPYFLVTLFLFLMLTGAGTMEAFIVPNDPLMAALIRPLIYFIELYCMVSMFHLMGYMIYQYHDELGVEIQEREERGSTIAAAPDDPLITTTKEMVQEGKLPEAVALVKRTIRGQGGTKELHEHYRKLLLLHGDKQERLRHAEQYIPVLMEALNLPYKAADIVAECYQIDPKFELSNPKYITTLAKHADQMGRHKLALQLTSGFANRFPKHKDIPANYFLLAKIMSDKMGNDEKALKILYSLSKRYPYDVLQPDIKEYIKVLESIKKT